MKEYKVLSVAGYAPAGELNLQSMLNSGWTIEKAIPRHVATGSVYVESIGPIMFILSREVSYAD